MFNLIDSYVLHNQFQYEQDWKDFQSRRLGNKRLIFMVHNTTAEQFSEEYSKVSNKGARGVTQPSPFTVNTNRSVIST